MFKRNTVTPEAVEAALGAVTDPITGQDLVSANIARHVTVAGGRVGFTLALPLPTYARKNQLEREARAAVAGLPGVERVDLQFDIHVPGDGRMRELLGAPVHNVIAIASGKGGVGKSTVAVNLAVVLAQCGARVGLLDADIYGPNVPTMMGVDRLPPPKDNLMQPAEAHGVKVMSIGFLVKPEQPLIWRGPMLHTAIRQFAADVNWGELDFMIVDLPPGTGDAPLSVAQSLPLSGGVIVTLPQDVSLHDARRGLEMFRQLQVPLFGVVENMSYLELPDGSRMDIFGTGGGERLAQESGVPYLGGIPLDPAVREGGDRGIPVVVSRPDSPVAQALRRIGEDVAARVLAAASRQSPTISISMIG